MLIIAGVEYSPLEQTIMNVLSDGERHAISDFHEPDCDITDREAVYNRVGRLRTKIEPKGYKIICELYNRKTYYRLIRPLVFSE